MLEKVEKPGLTALQLLYKYSDDTKETLLTVTNAHLHSVKKACEQHVPLLREK